MTITELFNQKVSDAQSTIGGIRSFKEYCDAWSSKIMRFLEGDVQESSNKDVLSFTHKVSDTEQQLLYITKSQYNQAVNGDVESLDLRANDAGFTVNVDAETILDEIEENTAEVRCQGEFLGYLLNNESVRATEFMTSMRVKMQDAAGAVIDKYSDLIVENNPLQSVRNFFELAKKNTPSKRNEGETDEYIQIVTDAPYVGGNPWAVAFDQVGAEISSFFNVVWNGILHIGEFFEAILKGIVKLIKWFIAKMFKPVMTNFSKSGPKDGIMDLPLFQFPLCYFDKVDGHYTVSNKFVTSPQWDYFTNNYSNTYHTWGGANLLNYKTIAPIDAGNCKNIYSDLIDVLVKPLIYCMDDGSEIIRPYDVFIPCGGQPFQIAASLKWTRHTKDMVLRIGVGQENNHNVVYIQGFIADTYDNWQEDSDSVNLLIAKQSLCESFKYISNAMGFTPSKSVENIHMDSWTSDYVNYLGPAFIDTTGVDYESEDPINWHDRIKQLSTIAWPSSFEGVTMVLFYMLSILRYVAIFGPSYSTDYYPVSSEQNIETLTTIRNKCFNIGTNQGTYIYYNTEIYVDVSTPINVLEIANTFRPYSQYNMYNPVIHYQTFSERVSEAKTYIYAAMIAAAVVVTLAVVKHFRNKRMAKLQLAQAAMDQMSWDIAHGLPKENPLTIKDFMKQKKKVRRISKMNSLLGISSSSSEVLNNSSMLGTLTRQMFAMQGASNDNSSTDVTLQSIHDVIVGL